MHTLQCLSHPPWFSASLVNLLEEVAEVTRTLPPGEGVCCLSESRAQGLEAEAHQDHECHDAVAADKLTEQVMALALAVFSSLGHRPMAKAGFDERKALR